MRIIIVSIAAILIALAQIGAAGYLLYLWGSVGLGFGASAWSAFVLWLEMMGTGILLYLISVFMKD